MMKYLIGQSRYFLRIRRDPSLLRSDIHVKKEDSYLGPLLNQNDSLNARDKTDWFDYKGFLR